MTEVEESVLLTQLQQIFQALENSSRCGLNDRQTQNWSVMATDGRTLEEMQPDCPGRMIGPGNLARAKPSASNTSEAEVENINGMVQSKSGLKSYRNSNTNEEQKFTDTVNWSEKMKALREETGFMVQRGRSKVDGGGLGVFVTSGVIPKGYVAAIYPGVLYRFGDPILLQSVNNPYIFRCSNGWLVDGRDRGISRFIFRSCSGRDRMGPYEVSDTSWLEAAPSQSSHLKTDLSSLLRNPLAIGQYVNNHNNDCSVNVMYQEIDIPQTFPLFLRKFIPNIFYSSPSAEEAVMGIEPHSPARLIRTVVLVSLRQIEAGEELYSNYVSIVS